MNNNTLLTSAAAAKMLGVSLRTVQLWVEKEILQAWKTPGGHRRVSLDSINKLLDQQAIDAGFKKERTNLVIVEDDPKQRKLYDKFFKHWDLPVDIFFAEDGYQGLILIGDVKPKILITDLMMPSMDGFQMIRSIQKQQKLEELFIIVVSAMDSTSKEVVELCNDNIIVLQKPLQADKIKLLIEERISLINKRFK